MQTISDWKHAGYGLLISSISVAEVLALPTLTPSDIEKVRNFLREFISIPFDDALAETAALVTRTYNLKLPDAAIASAALSRNMPLVTRDQQFRKIKEITIILI